MKKLSKDKLSTKDIAYIKDIFNWNIVTQNKYTLYLDLVQDKNIKDELKELITMHHEFCVTLVKILERRLKNE